MYLQTAKIISPPSATDWSQVFIKGNLLAIMKITGEEEAAAKGKEIIERFQEYYGQTAGKVLMKLETALKKIEEETEGMKLEMVVGVILPIKSASWRTTGQPRDRAEHDFTWGHHVLYLGILHQGKVVLLRDSTLATILKGENKLISCSGFLQENDVFVLGTERFYQVVTEELLKNNLGKKAPDEVVELLAPLIHGGENGGVAAVIFKVGKEGAVDLAVRQEEKKFGFFLKKLSTFKEELRKLFRPYEQKATKKEQRMTMTIALVLAVLLLISVVFGWQKKKKETEKKKFNQIWEKIEYKYQEGKQLVAVNPILAKKLLTESLDLAKTHEDYPKIKEFEKEIEAELEKVIKEHELGALAVFLDLNLVKENLKGLDLDGWQKKMALLGQDGTVVSLDFGKKAEIKGKIEEGRLITLWGEKIMVLGNKIVAVGNTAVIEKDWTEAVGFESYAGNLYLLDKEGKIWKYPAGFGSKRSWLGSGESPDLSQAIDLAIDGDVWVLLARGSILKFSHGSPQVFGIAGLDKELNYPTALYTDEDSQSLYILDQGNQRVVVILKNGEYESQYLSEDMNKATDLVVNEEEKKMLLLSEDKIFEIELR